jgi:dihydrofolate reductase
MGKLIVTEMVTVGGVAQAPSGPDQDRSGDFAYGGWQAPDVNAEVDNLMFAPTSTRDALLLGRRTYEIFAGRRQVEHRPDQGE